MIKHFKNLKCSSENNTVSIFENLKFSTENHPFKIFSTHKKYHILHEHTFIFFISSSPPSINDEKVDKLIGFIVFSP
jgi:hypothetical protein